VREAPAILAAWFLGCESGHALADLIFGDHSPSGRLPVSFPQVAGQQPLFYNHRHTGRPQLKPDETKFKSRYRDVTHAALYPFGHGLTYSDIAYGDTQASSATLPWDGEVRLSATISNRGSRPAREVAQLYIHQRVATLVRPVRELRGFQAVELQPGETRTVSFTLARADLAYAGADGRPVVEPGGFEFVVAPNASAGTPITVTLRPAGAG
jgi:beta-glucosidase